MEPWVMKKQMNNEDRSSSEYHYIVSKLFKTNKGTCKYLFIALEKKLCHNTAISVCQGTGKDFAEQIFEIENGLCTNQY